MDINGEAISDTSGIGVGVEPQIENEKNVSADSRGILKDPKTGKFIKGHCGRPKGALSKSTVAKNLILESSPALVKRAMEIAEGGNASMMSTLLAIALPTNRSQLEAVAIPGIENCHDLESKTEAIMNAVTNGVISPDTGLQMISGLDKAESARRLRLLSEQISDLKARVIDGRGLVKRVE